MFGLTRREGLYLLLLLFIFGVVVTFRAGAAGFIDPDEPFYALTAKEMLVSGNWMTPTLFGQPQFEKPVFAYWVYLVLFRMLGIHEWSARLGPSLAAIGTLVATAVLSKSLFRRSRIVVLSTLFLASSGLYIALSRVVLTDMFLCFFVTAALASFARGWKDPASRPIAWRIFFVWMGFGFLTKGPLGVILPLGAVLAYSLISGQKNLLRELPWRSGLLLGSTVAAPWYAGMAAQHGAGFLTHFFWHENVRRFFIAEHRSMDQPFFYPLVLFLGVFPWCGILALALQSQLSRLRRGTAGVVSSRLFLMIFLGGGFFFFMAAKSKLISYVFPLFPVLAILCGEWADRASRWLRRSSQALPPGMRITFFMAWIIVPLALVGGVMWYDASQALEGHLPVRVSGCLCVLMCAAAFWALTRNRLLLGVSCAAGMAFIVSMMAFGWVLPTVDERFSSRDIVEDFRQDGVDPSKGTILSNKISVRGISYYANNPSMAVVTGNPKRTFYTPHPLPMISGPGDLNKIDPSHFPLYGIMRRKEIDVLRQVAGSQYSLHVLEADDRMMVVRIKRA